LSLAASLQERIQPLLPGLIGLRVTYADTDRIEAELTVRTEVTTEGGILHGGAIMALADTVGALGAFVNLREGQGTTTLESKTNFFAAAPLGQTVTATATALHKGGRTMVWQTNIRLPDGKLVAQVTQTQMVLQPRA
jgi:uncharacterized protein (TIGR00369 family)